MATFKYSDIGKLTHALPTKVNWYRNQLVPKSINQRGGYNKKRSFAKRVHLFVN